VPGSLFHLHDNTMSIERREFLKSSLALFGVTLWPYRVRGQEVAESTVTHHVTPRCYLGLEHSRNKVWADGVAIHMCKDLDEPHRSPCFLKLKTLSGDWESVKEFISKLADITHNEDVLFGMDTWYHGRGIPLAFRFKRLVITSCGKVAVSEGIRHDDYGWNGGKDIILPDHQRMATVADGIDLMSYCSPEAVRNMAYEWYEQRQSKPGFDYEKLHKEYEIRRLSQTPEEQEAEDDAVQRYAQSKSQGPAVSIYEGALPKDFDPKAFGRGVIRHPFHGKPDEFAC
jgi:hypothetical protein